MVRSWNELSTSTEVQFKVLALWMQLLSPSCHLFESFSCFLSANIRSQDHYVHLSATRVGPAFVSSSHEEMLHCGYKHSQQQLRWAVVCKRRWAKAPKSFSDSPTACTSLATDVRVTDRSLHKAHRRTETVHNDKIALTLFLTRSHINRE